MKKDRAPPEDFVERLEGADVLVTSSSFEKKAEENISLFDLDFGVKILATCLARECSNGQIWTYIHASSLTARDTQAHRRLTGTIVSCSHSVRARATKAYIQFARGWFE